MSERSRALLLYDGDCGLCHGLVQWLLQRDRRDALRFAPIQGEVAAVLLPKHGFNPSMLDTVFLVQGWGTADERIFTRSDAALGVVAALGGFWRVASALRVVPRFIRDRVYDFIARNRIRWFGHAACRIPTAGERRKFVEGA